MYREEHTIQENGARAVYFFAHGMTGVQVADGTMKLGDGLKGIGVSIISSVAGAVAGSLIPGSGALISMENAGLSTLASSTMSLVGNSMNFSGKGISFDKKKLESASAWENVGISTLESAGAAGVCYEINGPVQKDDKGNPIPLTNTKLAEDVLARGAINTVGGFAQNALLKKSAQQSWGSVLETGLVNTAVDGATTALDTMIANSSLRNTKAPIKTSTRITATPARINGSFFLL